ncbi:MAG: hypothetical protein ACRDGD_10435 [Candidatus Limnocylindria bacterium]
MSPNRRLAALPLAMVASLMLVGSALAVPPIRNVEEVDVTFPLPEFVCGVPLLQNLEGTIRDTTFLNRDGDPVRLFLTQSSWRITLINPANGASVTTVGSASSHVTFHEDGSVTEMITGLFGHFKSADGDMLGGGAHIVLEYPADGGPPTVVAENGRIADGPFPDVCALLV